MTGTSIAAEILAPTAAPVVETKVEAPKAEAPASPEPKKPVFTSMTKEERIKAAQDAADKLKAEPVKPAEAAKAPEAKVQTEEEKQKAVEFGAAARREKEFRERTEKTKAELAQREAKIKEQESTLTDLRNAMANAKKDPNAWLKMAGLTYDEVTQSVLNGGKLTPEDALKAADKKIEDFKAEQQRKIEELVKQEQEQLEQQKEKLRQNFKNACLDFPTKAPEQFEYLKKFPGSGEYIHEVIIQDLVSNRQTNPNYQPMSLEKAAGMVETWLEKQVEGMSGTKKFQSKFRQSEAKKEEPKVEEGKVLVKEHTRAAPPKTITASMSASTISINTHKKNTSKQERLERAKQAVQALKK